jgi:hypothetical protein
MANVNGPILNSTYKIPDVLAGEQKKAGQSPGIRSLQSATTLVGSMR